MAPLSRLREGFLPARGGADDGWDSQEFHEKGRGTSEVHEEWTATLFPGPLNNPEPCNARISFFGGHSAISDCSVLPRRKSSGHSRCVPGAAKHHRYLVSLRWGWSSPVGHLVQHLILPSPQPYLWSVPRSGISSLVPFKANPAPSLLAFLFTMWFGPGGLN